VVGDGTNAVKVLPRVPTVLANSKSNIRDAYHGVSDKHLYRYLAEFCYRCNRRFWQPNMFSRIIAGCIGTNTRFLFEDERVSDLQNIPVLFIN
jgi:hypothetical protein